MSVTSTCRKTQRSVRLDPSSQHLVYEVCARGAQPIFTLADAREVLLLSDLDPQGKPGCWRRIWPKTPDEIPPTSSITHTLGMTFLAAVAYTYRVERRGPGDEVTLIKDCDYESQRAEDKYFTSLTVRGLRR